MELQGMLVRYNRDISDINMPITPIIRDVSGNNMPTKTCRTKHPNCRWAPVESLSPARVAKRPQQAEKQSVQ